MSKWRAALMAAAVAALFEGAIRKWILPQGQEIVYFLKDLFLLGAYVRFFLFPDQSIRNLKVAGPITILGMVAFLVGLSALNPNIGSIAVAAFGLKTYLFYIPMAFMVPHLFRNEDDMAKKLSWFVLLAIPICLLGVLQFFSPAFSTLNVYAHEAGTAVDEMHVDVIGGDHARITATFSYISGMVTFVVLFTGLAMALLLTPNARFRPVIMFVVLPLLASNAMMSGARAAVLGQGLCLAGFVWSSMTTRLSVRSAFITTSLAVLVILGSSVFIFKDALGAFLGRSVSHDARVELSERLKRPITTISQGLDSSNDYMGYGIGTTHPAAESVRSFLHQPEPHKRPPYTESEVAQIATELGAIGFFAWYFLRCFLVVDTWRRMNASPVGFYKTMSLACLSYQLIHLNVQMVFNHTSNFFFWALYGLVLTHATKSRVYHRPRQEVRTFKERQLAPQPAYRGR